MLEFSAEQSVVELAWDKIELKTRLPEDLHDFFEQLGPTPRRSGCRRAYQRYFVRGKAILRRQDTDYGVFSADASRQGVHFLSPVELSPKERASIQLSNTKEFQIEIVRCHCVDELCYDCGAIFVLGK